jgi:Domain of unknown function (DUF4440)
MKRIKLFRTLGFISIFLGSCTILHAQSEESKRLLSIQRRHYDAMIHKDTTLLASLLADSLTYIHSSGIIDNKKSFLKDIGSGRITYMFILPEKVTATVDGNHAWIYGRANIRFKLSVMTVTIDQYVSFVEVYQYKNNQWQMVICHNARIEPNAPYINNFVPQVKSGSMPSIY